MSASRPSENLYQLLPALYRASDLAEGEPLRALLGILEQELRLVEQDIDRQYQSWFVETCDEWVLPYIGDLVGAPPLRSVSQRAYTANYLGYKRRKGTLPVLEALARDVTRWPARAVEYLQLVATAQNTNAVRPDNRVTLDVRRPQRMEDLLGAFETTPHMTDVRASGRYQVSQVGLFLWRLQAFSLDRVQAAPVTAAELPGGIAVGSCFRFSPLGHDLALWNPGRTAIGGRGDVADLPQPLDLCRLYAALEAHRQSLVDGQTPADPYFSTQPVLRVYVAAADGTPTPIPAEQVLIARLATFSLPASARSYRRTRDGSTVTMPISVAVDPERGRLAFPQGVLPSKVFVGYSYGAATEFGGGGYDRQASLQAVDGLPGTIHVMVPSGDPKNLLGQLGSPAGWQALSGGASGVLRYVLELVDSQSYSVGSLQVPAGIACELRAQNGQRPHVYAGTRGATWQISLGQGASLTLNGLLIEGALALSGPAASAATAAVSLLHCTLVPGTGLHPDGSPTQPGAPALLAGDGLASLTLSLQRCISGPVSLPGCGLCTITDSVLDGNGSSGVALQAQSASLQRVTVLGKTLVGALTATTDTLFSAPVSAPASAAGSVSYCYLPSGSNVPSPLRCQPAQALADAGSADAATKTQILATARPWFVSQRYGTAAYAQLDMGCHSAVLQGGSNLGEMGLLHDLYQSQRQANLLASCDAELRFGIYLNLIYAT